MWQLSFTFHNITIIRGYVKDLLQNKFKNFLSSLPPLKEAVKEPIVPLQVSWAEGTGMWSLGCAQLLAWSFFFLMYNLLEVLLCYWLGSFVKLAECSDYRELDTWAW